VYLLLLLLLQNRHTKMIYNLDASIGQPSQHGAI